WLGGEYDRLPTLMADLVGRRVEVIATPGSTVAASAAKTATTTIPIVFGVGEDPVTLGLVSSLARPGGNATGINIFIWEVSAKRLALLHELAPRAVRVAVVINPGNVPSAEATLRELPEAARAIGLQIQILNARTSREIEAAFATLVRDRADALFVAPDSFFISRRVQFASLAMRHGIPAAYGTREEVEAGGLMSYGTDTSDMWRQVGVYAGQVLKGAKPMDLPVMQATKFELVINLNTARALRFDVPPTVLARALFNPAMAPYAEYWLDSFKAAAASFAVEAIRAPIPDSSELESIIAAQAREPNSGLFVLPDSFTFAYRIEIVSLAARYRLPAVYAFRFFTALGGLLSYGNDLNDNFRQAGTYADRILKGEKPSELPVQAPVKFQLVINLKTARTLGL